MSSKAHPTWQRSSAATSGVRVAVGTPGCSATSRPFSRPASRSRADFRLDKGGGSAPGRVPAPPWAGRPPATRVPAATHWLLSLPTPPTSDSIRSPGLRNSGGWRAQARPPRGPGGDQLSREQRHADGEPADDLVDRVDHVARGGVLLHLAVHEQPERERLRVGHLVGGDDPGAGGAGAVQALALEELAAPAVLDVPGADVVDDRVAEDVAERSGALDVDPGLADDDAELDLPVDLVAH